MQPSLSPLDSLHYRAMDRCESGIIILDVCGTTSPVSYANEGVERITGRPQHELLGKSLDSIYLDINDPNRVRDLVRRAREGTPESAVFNNIGYDGRERWVQMTLSPVRDESESVTHLIAITQDYSARKAMERTILENEERQRLSVQFARIGTFDLDLIRGSIIYSDEALRILGLSGRDLEGIGYRAFLNYIAPSHRRRFSRALVNTVKHGQPLSIELAWQPPGKPLIWLQVVGQTNTDKPRRILGIVHDVTERKTAENELILFQRVIDEVDLGVALCDTEFNYVYCNRSYEKLLGYSGLQLARSNHRVADHIVAEDMARIRSSLVSREPWENLVSVTRRDGSRFVASLHAGSTSGRKIDSREHYYLIISDYTSELRRQLELSEARDQAEMSNRAKSEFLSQMSHELRTPLNAILGFAQIMDFDGRLTETQVHNLNEITQAADHLLTLINEILDLSKLDTDAMDVSMDSVNVAEVAERCVALVEPLAVKNAVTIELDNLDCYVLADVIRFKQVLINLITNAIKYNRRDGQVKVQARVGRDGFTTIEVRDTGIGIEQSDMERLFKPFERLGNKVEGIEGTGIGLMITRRLTEAMGGQVGAVSEPGVGSTFWVRLASSGYVDGAVVRTPAASEPGSGAEALRRRKLLYVEANVASLTLVQQVLSARPHIQFIGERSASQSLETARREKPDIILVDIDLDDGAGYQLLERLRAEDWCTQVPVLAVTADGTTAGLDRGLEAGFNAYITKPLDIAQFLSTLDRFA